MLAKRIRCITHAVRLKTLRARNKNKRARKFFCVRALQKSEMCFAKNYAASDLMRAERRESFRETVFG